MSTATIDHTAMVAALAERGRELYAMSLELDQVTAERDTLQFELDRANADREAAEHKVADLEDRNRELASDLDDALDIAGARALSPERERLVSTPIYGHAFAGLVNNHEREGIER